MGGHVDLLLDGGGREILRRFGFGKGHLEEGGLDTKASSQGLEPTDAATSRI